MTPIARHDIVSLTRSLSDTLPEGMIGRVLYCHAQGFEVQFPTATVNHYAHVSGEDLKFLVGGLAPEGTQLWVTDNPTGVTHSRDSQPQHTG